MTSQIVTFYSFKGGSGRSQLAANLAAFLCYYENKKILIIDWDLEAPGIDYFFKYNRKNINKGLIEVFEEYIHIAKSGERVEMSKLPKLDEVYPLVEEKIYNKKKKDKTGKRETGKIDFIPAANYNSDNYSHRINSFDWFDFYEKQEGRYYIEFLKEDLKKKDYDFIFIDSRTGISDYLGICNIQLPDINVIVVAPSAQNIDGAFKIATKILEHPYTKGNRPNSIVLPIFSRIDNSLGDKTKEWTMRFLEVFKPILENTFKYTVGTKATINDYVEETTIFYEKELAFGENLKFTKHIEDFVPNSIEKSIASIWGYLVDNNNTFNEAYFYLQSKIEIPAIITAPTASVPTTFLGREKELQDIRRLLSSGNALALVNSEGGMGKTTLAAAYWNQYHDQYKHLAWLFCENGILSAMRSQLPRPLGLQEAMNAYADSPENQHTFLKNNLANLDKDCLLVLDSANDPVEIKAFLAAMNGLGWHVLITSRCTKVLPNSTNEYPITSLPPDLAKQLFKGNYTETSPDFEALLDRFLKAVGYNTLCIEIFSKNLREGGPWGYTFDDFLLQLEKGGLFLGDNSFDISTDYTGNVRNTAQSSDEIIRALYDFADLVTEATDLLIRFSLLPAESYTPDVLLALLPNDNKQAFKRRLDDLAQKGWLASDTKSYRVSPVVQKIVLHQHADLRWPLAEPMIQQLHAIFETEGYHSKNIATAAPFAALVFGLIENVDAANDDIAILFDRLWVYFTATGNLAQAMDTATRMRDVCEKYEDKNYLSISYSRLGETQIALGNLDKALDYFEKTSKLFTELYEAYPNNVSFKNGLAKSYRQLGGTHNSLGDLDKTLDYFEKTSKLFTELYEAFPNNVEFKYGLAISYSKLGDTQTALGNLEQALNFYEERSRLGKELYEAYPNNVSFKHNLAISYSKLGNTRTALGNLEQALNFYEEYNRLEKALYAAYPNNVEFKHNLAISYSTLGETQTALGNLEQALNFYEKFTSLMKELYEVYPNNVEFKNNLAISYSKLGDTQTALGNLEQALNFYEERSRLGKELYEAYPNNVSFKNGLAVSFYKLGAFSRDKWKNHTKAKGYFQKAEKLWVELVRDAPQYVQFQKFLGKVQRDLKDLD